MKLQSKLPQSNSWQQHRSKQSNTPWQIASLMIHPNIITEFIKDNLCNVMLYVSNSQQKNTTCVTYRQRIPDQVMSCNRCSTTTQDNRFKTYTYVELHCMCDMGPSVHWTTLRHAQCSKERCDTQTESQYQRHLSPACVVASKGVWGTMPSQH